ncbi:DUF1549 and DUF1553 domain-containing protein [Fimbriiglobus ruber]|uniref:BIG2 domain-containing protein n=1 Tax=Fimbriiglobus ruber TaxID=1908690 RepID=A0A225DIF4_9BACT|nr:DUF1549 and DUF1553 domain-containing protein [Fimbriiglobus ruber]OWK40773.1 hypothetical protein FRUB_04665 [Fimbriiglobus ruber]
MTSRFLSTAAVVCAAAILSLSSAYASPPSDDDKTALVGQPASLTVAPAAVTLTGPRDVRQLVVTGTYPNGVVRDLTWAVAAKSDKSDVLTVGEGLFLRGAKNGTATLTLSAGGKETTVAVTIAGLDQPKPVSFRHDVMAAFNVGGCNMGACHGTPSGKNGFKLSLRGFDPAADYNQLTREQFGRRSDRHNPDAALILLKGLGRVPHEGGARFGGSSYPSEAISTWLAEGLQDDSTSLPAVKSLDVAPGARVLLAPAKWQQLSVTATYADGAKRDVTRLTNFSCSDPAIADVNLNGLVEFKRPGEVAVLVRYLEEMVSVRLTYLEPRANFAWTNPPEPSFIDKHVFAKLRQMTILPSDVCTDAEFVRRAYLDAIGRMPTAGEAKVFLADAAADKRAKLVDRLVTEPEFADFWALKWADVLRSSRKTIQLKGSHAFHLWLREKIATNTGIDQIVRDLITSTGNTFTNPPANYYRIAKDPQGLAESTAQLFLGVRMQCAKCHNHPFERWTQDDYYGFAAIFARVKNKPAPENNPGAKGPNAATAEVVMATRDGEVTQPRTGKTMKPRFPGSGDQDVKPGADRREAFAVWLTAKENPFFAKSVANRVWFHLMGKGIVDPVDDFRESNPSCNDELLDALGKDFAANQFDLRHIVSTVMKSRTYQLSAQPNETNKDDGKYFSHAVTKLLTAEQLLDALCDVTAVPEKFAGLPAGTRAIQLPDGEINHPFLKTFGQPARELACECERESDGNLAQALQLINGPTVNEKVRNANNRLGPLLSAKTAEKSILEEIYLTALARTPDAEEVKTALAHVAKGQDKRRAWEDVLWAVINTREFLFRH